MANLWVSPAEALRQKLLLLLPLRREPLQRRHGHPRGVAPGPEGHILGVNSVESQWTLRRTF